MGFEIQGILAQGLANEAGRRDSEDIEEGHQNGIDHALQDGCGEEPKPIGPGERARKQEREREENDGDDAAQILGIPPDRSGHKERMANAAASTTPNERFEPGPIL